MTIHGVHICIACLRACVCKFMLLTLVLLVAVSCSSKPPSPGVKPRFVNTEQAIPSTTPPQQPLVVLGDALFALRSSDGRALSLRTFEIRSNKVALDEVFTTTRGLYVEQSDSTIVLIPMDKLAGYSFDGKTAIATLLDGGRILGSPFTASVKGQTRIGEVTVDGKDITEVKTAPDRVKKFMQTQKPYLIHRPEDLKIRGNFTLTSGSTLFLTSVGLQTSEYLCDHNWIPCKPYHSYDVGGKLSIKYGGFASQLELSKIEQLGVRKSGDTNSFAFTIKLRDGESIEAMLNEVSDPIPRAEAFVGVDDRGVIFIIPFKAIQSVTLK